MRDVSINDFARDPKSIVAASASEAQIVRDGDDVVIAAGSDRDARLVVPDDGDDDEVVSSSSVSTPFPRDLVDSDFLR